MFQVNLLVYKNDSFIVYNNTKWCAESDFIRKLNKFNPLDFEAFLVYKNGTYSELSTIL